MADTVTVTRQITDDPRAQWRVDDGTEVSYWDSERAVKGYLKAHGGSQVEWKEDDEQERH